MLRIFGLKPRSSPCGIPPPAFRVDYEARVPGIKTVKAAENPFRPRSHQNIVPGSAGLPLARRGGWRLA